MIAKLSSYSPRGILYIPPISRPIFAGLLLLAGSVCTEEEYIWKDAIVTSPFGIFTGTAGATALPDNLIHGTTFKDIVVTSDVTTTNQWYMIDQGEFLKAIRIYIQNRWRKRKKPSRSSTKTL